MRKPKRFYRHMTPHIAQQIRVAYRSRLGTQREIGERFGIRQNTVSRIISGLVWTR